MEEDATKKNSGIFTSIIWLIVIYLFFKFILGLVANHYKYQGENAEYWFNVADDYETDYRRLKNCIDAYSSSNSYQDLIQIRNCE